MTVSLISLIEQLPDDLYHMSRHVIDMAALTWRHAPAVGRIAFSASAALWLAPLWRLPSAAAAMSRVGSCPTSVCALVARTEATVKMDWRLVLVRRSLQQQCWTSKLISPILVLQAFAKSRQVRQLRLAALQGECVGCAVAVAAESRAALPP